MEFGWMILRMMAVLAGVCGLAYVMLRWGVRRFVPGDPTRSKRLEVVDRLGVAPKQSLLVVRAADQVWLIGSSEAGLQMLGGLDAEQWRREKVADQDESST